MTVRLKMLAISAIILVPFAIVLVGSVVTQKQSGDKVAVAALARRRGGRRLARPQHGLPDGAAAGPGRRLAADGEMNAEHRVMPGGTPVASNLGDSQRGLSLIEIVIALLVVSVASAGLYAYLGQTKKSLEAVHSGQVVGYTRLTADLATLAAIRSQLDLYHATHGQWPTSKEASAEALRPPPRFQCPGNDYTFDPSSGAITLLIMDPGRC